MVETIVDIRVSGSTGIVKVNGIISLEYLISVKNLVSKLTFEIPITNLIFSGNTIRYGDMEISIGDRVDVILGLKSFNIEPPSKEYTGFITNFILSKQTITIEIEGLSYQLRKMPRVKFSLYKASVKDIILEATKGFSTDNKTGGTIDINFAPYPPFKIYYDNLTFDGNFIIKDNMSPFDIIQLITDELEIHSYSDVDGVFVSKRPDFKVKYFAYPYEALPKSKYNFVIDIDIEQYRVDLSDTIIKVNSTKSTTEKLKLAYGLNKLGIPDFLDYTETKDTTIQIEYPSVDIDTLKKLVLFAWEKIQNERQKEGSFTTFVEKGVSLSDIVELKLYEETARHQINSVETTFNVSDGIRQKIYLGKKTS